MTVFDARRQAVLCPSYLARALAAMSAPGLWVVRVSHDDWCPMVGGDGSKPCTPDIVVEAAPRGMSN